LSKNLPVASSKVSAKTCTFLLPVEIATCSKETPKAKNSPKESHLK